MHMGRNRASAFGLNMRDTVRLLSAKTEQKPTQKAEGKGPTFAIIKRLPVGVAVEQAKQTAARAIADLVGGAR